MVVDVPRLADGHNYESFMSSTGSRTRGYSPFGLRVFQTQIAPISGKGILLQSD